MRSFKTQEEIEQERRAKRGTFGRIAYPTHKKLLIYGRQSTAKQVTENRESYEQQTQDLLEKALDFGWEQDDITIFVENEYDKYGQKSDKLRDASGNLSIDERAALKLITLEVEHGGVGAVMMWDVSRLTRDEDVIDAPVFAKLCRDYHVLVFTNDDMFDFNNRKEDIDRFITLAIEAKNYRIGHVMHKMLPAKERVALRGEYSGHPVPAGYMLDDTRKFYEPNPEWAPIIAKLFKRFRELDGNATELHKEITHTMLFPKLSSNIARRVGYVMLARVQDGYTLKSIKGLQEALVNVAYIGHMAYDGRIVKRNAHPAIVDEQDFFFAFNTLSKTDLDGHIIERPQKVVRYEQKAYVERERTEALLSGTRQNGKTVVTSPGKSFYVSQRSTLKNQCSYCLKEGYDSFKNMTTIFVTHLDKIVEERLLWNLRPNLGIMPTKDRPYIAMPDKPIYTAFKAVEKQEETSLTTTDTTIAELERSIARLDREYKLTFDIMTDNEIRDNRASKARLLKRLDDVKKKQEHEEQEQADIQEAQAMLHSGTIQERWHAWDIDKKRKFLRLVTRDIVLNNVMDTWLKLTIVWHPSVVTSPYTSMDDVCYIFRRTNKNDWTNEEIAFVREHYKDMPRMELETLLPRRSWESIKTKAQRMNIERLTREKSIEHAHLSINDIAFMQEQGLELENPEQRLWWQKATHNGDTSRCRYWHA